MNLNTDQYDLIRTGGWVSDPYQSIEGGCDVGVREGALIEPDCRHLRDLGKL